MLKKYKPNHLLYLISVNLFFLVFLTSTYNLSLKSNYETTVFLSAIMSLSSGGLASIFVAWLIDTSNCKIRNIELNTLREGSLLEFHLDLCLLLILFESKCKKHVIKFKGVSQTWDKWAKDFYTNEVWTKMNESEVHSFESQLDELVNRYEEIKKQMVVFNSQGIIDIKDTYEFSSIIMNLKILIKLSKDVEKENMDACLELIDSIKESFDYIEFLRRVNKITSSGGDFFLEFNMGKKDLMKLNSKSSKQRNLDPSQN